ncbi:MAG: transposase, partial [Hyphomicrobiales bacterium]
MIRTVLTQEQWERVAPLLPGKATDPGATARDNRVFLEGVLWIVRTGSPWRDLPEVFGHWNS